MSEESIDSRNSMLPPFLAYDLESNVAPVTESQIEEAKLWRERLEKVHLLKPQVNIWRDLE